MGSAAKTTNPRRKLGYVIGSYGGEGHIYYQHLGALYQLPHLISGYSKFYIAAAVPNSI